MRFTKKTLAYALTAAVVAFFLQALWETPLRPLVWKWTYIGGWVAWHVIKPVEGNNAAVWGFDLTAIIINAIVYFLVMSLVDYCIRLRRGRQQRAS